VIKEFDAELQALADEALPLREEEAFPATWESTEPCFAHPAKATHNAPKTNQCIRPDIDTPLFSVYRESTVEQELFYSTKWIAPASKKAPFRQGTGPST
jgi:hypothetical protein